MEERKRSGFDCPVYGVIIPEGFKFEKNEDGLLYLVPPEGAEVPEELKSYVKKGE